VTLACRCHNSLTDISEKTRVVSQILRSTRKIWKNELITIFGLTSAITNADEISGLKQAQKKRNSDLCRTSIQYTVLGNIHGKEVYLVPPQDAALLLEDRISLKLRTHLTQHNALEGVGQLANHTCCDIRWNANLQVTDIDHCKEWVCVEREPIWGTEVTHNRLSKLLDICFSTRTKDIDPTGDTPVRQCVLPDQDRPNIDLEGVQLMTCNYMKGTEGHYMPGESFLNLRKYERMIEKITLPTLIHLLDHIIIPINVQESHWFPAHIHLQTLSISLLDSSQTYSAAAYPQQ